jgi:hypothetical protein
LSHERLRRLSTPRVSGEREIRGSGVGDPARSVVFRANAPAGKDPWLEVLHASLSFSDYKSSITPVKSAEVRKSDFYNFAPESRPSRIGQNRATNAALIRAPAKAL